MTDTGTNARTSSPERTSELASILSEAEFSECISEAEKYPGLTPNYFAGRKIAERFMSQFKDEHLAPLVDSFVGAVREKLEESFTGYLLSDAESNLQGEIWYTADRTVQALLTGQEWALRQYVLNPKYDDGERVRAAVAKHIPSELQDVRIGELETKNAELKKELSRVWEMYR